MAKNNVLKFKKMRMEIKEVSSDGSFEGLLSPYGNVDAGGDMVETGAFAKTLKEHGNTVPLLWQHKKEYPIGLLTLDDRDDGLYCKGQLEMELSKAQEAYICLKNRIIKGLSIGYTSMKDSIENGIRHLKEIRLYEGSVVTFPMNEAAMVTSVKAYDGIKGDFNEELEELQVLDGYYQLRSALFYALNSLLWSDMSKEEKVTMSQTILEQFTETFNTFFPKYLDTLESAYGPSESWSSNVEQETKQILTGLLMDVKDIRALLGKRAGSTTPAPEAADPKEPADDHSAKDKQWAMDSLKGFKDLLSSSR